MKKLLIGVAIVIILLIAVVIAAPFFIPVDTVTAEVVSRVKAATGRDLKIGGKVSFSILPILGVEANDVSFSNPAGAGSPDMAKFAKLQVALKFWPLLRKQVEVDKLVLVNPVIALEVNKQGRPNWQFGEKPAATTPARPGQPAPAAGAGGGIGEITLEDVRLENGQISYLDQRSGEKLVLDQITMKLSLPNLDSPLAADGSLVYRGEKLSLNVSMASPRNFMEAKSTGLTLKLASKPVNADFKGNVTGSTPLKLDGAVDLQVPSVRGLAQWAGTPLNAPGTGFGPLAISGKASVAGPKIAFSEAKLSLDNIKGTGELALDTGGVRPAVKGRLDVDKLDVNPYLPPETPSKPAAGAGAAQPSAGAPPTAPAGAGKSGDWSDQPIDVSALKAADADFALSAGSILYRKLQIGKSALGLHLKDGRFEADLTELALYKGAGKGKMVVDGSGAVPGIASDFNLSQVQIEPLLKDFMDMDRLSGVGAFDINVTGHGKSQREIISSLGGKGDLNLANGVIKGMNLVGMVKNIGNAFESSSKGAEQTDFASLTGTFTITNGVLHNNDLQLKSAEVPMTGAGTVDLPKRSVQYKVTPKVVGIVAVPVDISGPWDNLHYAPDLAGMVGDPSKLLKGGAQGAGELLKGGGKGAGDLLKSTPGGVGDALQGILGGSKKQ
jgi:AsmA protein